MALTCMHGSLGCCLSTWNVSVAVRSDDYGWGESSSKFNDEFKSDWSIVWTDDLCAGSIGWKCTLLSGLGSLVVGDAEGTVYIPFPFNCWHKTSTSAVMAMKSCSLEWADRMSHTPQRCSGRSNLGSPADLRNWSSVSRMCWSLMAAWVCWFFCTHWTS